MFSPEVALERGLIDEGTCRMQGGVVPRKGTEDTASGTDAAEIAGADDGDAAEAETPTETRRGAKDRPRARRTVGADRSNA